MLCMLAGCTVQTTKAKNADSSSKQIDKTTDSIIIDGMQITLSGFEEKKMINTDNKEIQVYTVHIKGENVSSFEKGLGAIDFVLTTNQENELVVTNNLISFGNSVGSGKQIEGDLYFELSKDEKPESVTYRPGDDDLYTWDIK